MNPDPDQMEAALRLIGGSCERFTRGRCSDEPNLSPYAQYGADRWCDACIACAGLDGTLPPPPTTGEGPDDVRNTSAFKQGRFEGYVAGYNAGRDDALAGVTAANNPEEFR